VPKLSFLIAFAAMFFAGCATTTRPHDTVAATGRIAEKHDATFSASPRAHNAGLLHGSPVGNLIIGLAGEPAHSVYVIVLSDGTKRFARSKEQFSIGACVSVATEASKKGQESWLYDESSLSLASSCGA
jgi:hypothetical protein